MLFLFTYICNIIIEVISLLYFHDYYIPDYNITIITINSYTYNNLKKYNYMNITIYSGLKM